VFVDTNLNERVFSSILPPHYHVILHAGLARSCRIHISKKAKDNLLPFEKLPGMADDWGID
jgi:hypothetical protein